MACLRMFVVVSAAVFLLITAITDSVSSQETCVTKLNPCLPYVNDTTSSIPNTCCNPVKEAITNESACLCSYYNTPGMLESVGIKPSRVADLIRDCKVDGADPDAVCKVSKGLSASPAGTLFPDPPPSSTAFGKRVAGVEVSSLFLLLASLVFY